MNLQSYLQQRQKALEAVPQYRKLCTVCLQPDFSCYCEFIEKFDPRLKFAILTHPIEAKRRIATGRMSHLCLQDSDLIVGQDYSNNDRVNSLIADPRFQPMILYPGRQSLNISKISSDSKKAFFRDEKSPLIFVIDGTWATARKTMRLSQNLKNLPRIGFTPTKPSHFRVRKQPSAECYSTIEAIHHTIDLLGSSFGFDLNSRKHDKLLFVFDKMVEKQLEFIKKSQANPKPSMYRRPRLRFVG